ncbi:MAG TPA: ribbon-helix-helix protein, CopG family [Thermoplasmata archaeon]|nr:ribbon-helix-helix protein, CopG family [Thermoplasmata archaeon]
MASARTTGSADRFLGVRLSAEELDRLDRYRAAIGSPSRSEAVRALLRASERPATGREELPVGLHEQVETLVEDGWAKSTDEALTLALTLGLQEMSRLYGERLPNLRQHARDGAERRKARRSAEREGRGLLER